MNNPMYDPGVLAGLAMMRGIKPHDAYSQAAETSYNMQQAMAKKQEVDRTRMLAQTLPGILQQLQGKSPQEIFQTLVSAGMPEENAAIFAKNMGTEAPEIEDVWHTNSQSGEEVVGLKENGRFTKFNVVQPSRNGMASLGQMPMQKAAMPMQSTSQMPRQSIQDSASQDSYSPMPAEPMGPQMPGQVNREPKGFEPPVLGYETPRQMEKREEIEAKEMQKYKDQAFELDKMKPVIDNTKDALAKFTTGPWANFRKSVGQYGKATIGTDFGINPQFAEVIEAAKTDLVMPVIQQNKGAASNEDMKLFLQSVPQLLSTPEGNQMIVEALDAVRIRAAEMNKAAQAYQQKFGTIRGFDVKWHDYTETKRLLGEDRQGILRFNKENITNWREDILGEPNPVQAKPSTIQKPKLSQEEIDKHLSIVRGR